MDRRRFHTYALAALAAAMLPDAQAANVGDTMEWPDLVLLDGTTLPASRLRGRVVVVEFWASWCPFCARQNPLLDAFYRQQRSRLEVVTFTIDKDPSKAKAYLADHGYAFPAARANAASERLFGKLEGLPVLYVVDGKGRIVQKEVGELFEEDVRALARHAGG